MPCYAAIGRSAGRCAAPASDRGRHFFERVAQAGARSDGAVPDDSPGRVGEGQLPQTDTAFLSRSHPGGLHHSVENSLLVYY